MYYTLPTFVNPSIYFLLLLLYQVKPKLQICIEFIIIIMIIIIIIINNNK